MDSDKQIVTTPDLTCDACKVGQQNDGTKNIFVVWGEFGKGNRFEVQLCLSCYVAYADVEPVHEDIGDLEKEVYICDAVSPWSGYRCTTKAGHDGQHINAYGGMW